MTVDNEVRLLGELSVIDSRVRAATGSIGTIGGYVAVYNDHTQFGGRTEYIERGAFGRFLERVRAGAAHVLALINHDGRRVVGTTQNGSLRLHDDERGLYAEIDLPDTTYGRDTYNAVRGGYIRGGSFQFLERGSEVTIERGTRVLKELSINEITIADVPAYITTTMDVKEPERVRAAWQQYDTEVDVLADQTAAALARFREYKLEGRNG